MRIGCVMQHIDGMCGDVVKLVAALNAVGRYTDAAHVQTVVAALGDIKDLSEFEDIEWPPHVYEEGDGTKDLRYAEDGKE